MASCSCGTRDKLYPRPPPGIAKGLVGAGCDFVRQSVWSSDINLIEGSVRPLLTYR